MKAMKRFGLIVLATVVAGAVSAPSASATYTALCSEDGPELACAPGNLIQSVQLEDPTMEFLSPNFNLECPNATFSGEVIGPALAETIVIEGEFHAEGCSAGCEIHDLDSSELWVLKTEVDLAEVLFVELDLELTCPIGLKCGYTGENELGHLFSETAEQPALLNMDELQLVNPASFCPVTAELDALYESATPLYVKS